MNQPDGLVGSLKTICASDAGREWTAPGPFSCPPHSSATFPLVFSPSPCYNACDKPKSEEHVRSPIRSVTGRTPRAVCPGKQEEKDGVFH